MRRSLMAASLPTSLFTTGQPIELLAAEAGADGRPSLPRFRMVAYTGAPMRVDGFDHPIVVDLAGMEVPSASRPILREHDRNRIVGHTETIAVSEAALDVAGVISGANADAQEIVATATNGFPWQASIGADVEQIEQIETGQTVDVNGRTVAGPLYLARRTVLREISFVPIGADGATVAAVEAAARIRGMAMTFEQWVLSLGFTVEDLTDQQRAALEIAFATAHPESGEEPAEGPADPAMDAADDDEEEPMLATSRRQRLAATRREMAAEITRQDQIRRLCATIPERRTVMVEAGGQRRDVLLEAHAIEQGWTVERTELEILRAGRPEGPAILSRSRDQDCTVQALQGAMILRAGGRLDHHSYASPRALAMGLPEWMRRPINAEQRQRIMEAAHRYADMSLVDLCREAVRLDGQQVPSGRTDTIRAAFSGSSLTKIFTTNVNAVLLATYEEAPDTTMGWVQEGEVSDFKTVEEVVLTKGPGLAKLPRGATADHTNRSDESETYRIARYATQFVVDEQDIIDDMLDALSDIPVEMGHAAARLRPDLVYATLLANPTLSATARALFNSTDGNLNTSAALAAATLRAGVAEMALVRENGVNLALAPTHLVVPQSLRHLAYELTNSSQILVSTGNTAGTERGDLNALKADGLTPVSESRLENGVIDPNSGASYAGSATSWYLVCARARTIRVAYLRGTGRAPQVRSFQLDRGQWGVGWDVKMDIGVKALDWKGLQKNSS